MRQNPAMPKCGKCGKSHPTSALVRSCYEAATETAVAEARGRRSLARDGATELTATVLRRSPTASEAALWRRLQRGVHGFRFAPQVPLLGYVVDFYCRRLRLAVEVDGESHRGQSHKDRLRQDDLEANHVAVVRVAARVVMEDIEAAVSALAEAGSPA